MHYCNQHDDLNITLQKKEDSPEDSSPSVNDSLDKHVAWIFSEIYSKPYSSSGARQTGDIAREHHEIQHVTRAAFYVPIIANLFRLYENADALKLTGEDVKLIQIATLLHDSARQGDGVDLCDTKSAEICYSYFTKILRVDETKAIEFAEAVANKDFQTLNGKNKYYKLKKENDKITWEETTGNGRTANLYQKIIHDADCLDIIRARPSFDANYLSFYQEIAKQNESAFKIMAYLIAEARSLIEIQGDGYRRTDSELKKQYEHEYCYKKVENDIKTYYVLNEFYAEGKVLTLEKLRQIKVVNDSEEDQIRDYIFNIMSSNPKNKDLQQRSLNFYKQNDKWFAVIAHNVNETYKTIEFSSNSLIFSLLEAAIKEQNPTENKYSVPEAQAQELRQSVQNHFLMNKKLRKGKVLARAISKPSKIAKKLRTYNDRMQPDSFKEFAATTEIRKMLRRKGVATTSSKSNRDTKRGNPSRSLTMLSPWGPVACDSAGFLIIGHKIGQVVKVSEKDCDSGRNKKHHITRVKSDAQIKKELQLLHHKIQMGGSYIQWKQRQIFATHNEIVYNIDEFNAIYYSSDPCLGINNETISEYSALLQAIFIQKEYFFYTGKKLPIFKYSGIHGIFEEQKDFTKEEIKNMWIKNCSDYIKAKPEFYYDLYDLSFVDNIKVKSIYNKQSPFESYAVDCRSADSNYSPKLQGEINDSIECERKKLISEHERKISKKIISEQKLDLNDKETLFTFLISDNIISNIPEPLQKIIIKELETEWQNLDLMQEVDRLFDSIEVNSLWYWAIEHYKDWQDLCEQNAITELIKDGPNSFKLLSIFAVAKKMAAINKPELFNFIFPKIKESIEPLLTLLYRKIDTWDGDIKITSNCEAAKKFGKIKELMFYLAEFGLSDEISGLRQKLISYMKDVTTTTSNAILKSKVLDFLLWTRSFPEEEIMLGEIVTENVSVVNKNCAILYLRLILSLKSELSQKSESEYFSKITDMFSDVRLNVDDFCNLIREIILPSARIDSVSLVKIFMEQLQKVNINYSRNSGKSVANFWFPKMPYFLFIWVLKELQEKFVVEQMDRQQYISIIENCIDKTVGIIKNFFEKSLPDICVLEEIIVEFKHTVDSNPDVIGFEKFFPPIAQCIINELSFFSTRTTGKEQQSTSTLEEFKNFCTEKAILQQQYSNHISTNTTSKQSNLGDLTKNPNLFFQKNNHPQPHNKFAQLVYLRKLHSEIQKLINSLRNEQNYDRFQIGKLIRYNRFLNNRICELDSRTTLPEGGLSLVKIVEFLSS